MTNYDQVDHGYRGFFETEYLDLAPQDDSVDMQCTSYAVWMSMRMLKFFSDRISIFSNLDNLPEELLDYLAVEWRIPYYNNDMDVGTKRSLLRPGFAWCMSAGTVKGMEELLAMLFDSGSITEWYDFEDGEKTPGLFDILVFDMHVPKETYEEFERVLRKVKNLRSHLRQIALGAKVDAHEYAGSVAAGKPLIKVASGNGDRREEADEIQHAASGASSKPHAYVGNTMASCMERTGDIWAARSATVSTPHIRILSGGADVQRGHESGAAKARSGAYSKVKITV